MTDYQARQFPAGLHASPYQECVRCVMDTSDPEISFDHAGVCSHCHAYDLYLQSLGDENKRTQRLSEIVDLLRQEGQGRQYDCVMGLSGGVDSSYLAWFAVRKLNLRPLVVHVDSGWNSELAVRNIESICRALSLDLHTLVIDWDEMRDLQLAYLRSGVANLDVPQDHAFNAAMLAEAHKFKVRHVLNGGNMQTESILPAAWGYDASDPLNLKDIHKKLGSRPLTQYPLRSDLAKYVIDPYLRRMRVHRILEFIDYKKSEAKAVLKSELGWRDYGGKHYESRFTKFFQACYLPEKFGYDKRRAHLSSLIVSGQLSRGEAVVELDQPLYSKEDLVADKLFFCKKLGISIDDFEAIMASPPKSYADYRNRASLYRRFSSVLQSVAYLLRSIKNHGSFGKNQSPPLR